MAGEFKPYAILHSDCAVPEVEGCPIVVDRRNEFGQFYVPKSGAGYLIRPDGYIGYYCDKINLDQLNVYLKRIFRDDSAR